LINFFAFGNEVPRAIKKKNNNNNNRLLALGIFTTEGKKNNNNNNSNLSIGNDELCMKMRGGI